MSGFDGSGPEMPEHRPVDDGAIEAALAGTTRDEADELALVVSRVRNAVEAVPAPSTAMAAVLAVGFSTEKGDLSATAASNVNGPAPQVSGPSKWRNARMKIQGFLAGLGIAGKIALGVGIAAAATTGASATGMLPFSIPGTGHTHHHAAIVTETTTTLASTPTTRSPAHSVFPPTRGHKGPTHIVVTPPAVTPTTSVMSSPTPTTDTTPTTVTEPTTVAAPPSPPTTTTPTTEPPATQSITLSCSVTGAAQVTCNWNTASSPVAKYALWRWSTGGGPIDYGAIYESATGLTFVDNTAAPGTPYTYRVFTTRGDGSKGDFSNRSSVTCCS